jgi:hypothetical protein
LGHLSRGALALVILLAGCGGGSGAGAAEAPRPMSTPALPDGVLLQLYVPETGELYRVADDGRFLVGDRAEQPRSKYEKGRDTISPRGLDRLREALDTARFFSLPPRVDTGDCVTDGAVIRNSGRKVLRRTVVFSARDGDQVATVEGKGDFAAPCTLAELEPVYRALDLEALGDWQNE